VKLQIVMTDENDSGEILVEQGCPLLSVYTAWAAAALGFARSCRAFSESFSPVHCRNWDSLAAAVSKGEITLPSPSFSLLTPNSHQQYQAPPARNASQQVKGLQFTHWRRGLGEHKSPDTRSGICRWIGESAHNTLPDRASIPS
jgi:hypothetical protein